MVRHGADQPGEGGLPEGGQFIGGQRAAVSCFCLIEETVSLLEGSESFGNNVGARPSNHGAVGRLLHQNSRVEIDVVHTRIEILECLDVGRVHLAEKIVEGLDLG